MTITVEIGRESVVVERDVFVALFDNSVVSEYVGFTKELASEVIEFDELVRLARKADIPYSLFFAPLEYPVSADVLNLVREVMSTVPPGDKDLIDLYHVRGNADPILVATALDAIAKSEETLLVEDWQIVTDDEGVKKKASEFDLRTVSSAESRKLVGGTATGNGSN